MSFNLLKNSSLRHPQYCESEREAREGNVVLVVSVSCIWHCVWPCDNIILPPSARVSHGITQSLCTVLPNGPLYLKQFMVQVPLLTTAPTLPSDQSTNLTRVKWTPDTTVWVLLLVSSLCQYRQLWKCPLTAPIYHSGGAFKCVSLYVIKNCSLDLTDNTTTNFDFIPQI